MRTEKDCCTQWVQPVCAGLIGWEREALELRTLALDLNPGSSLSILALDSCILLLSGAPEPVYARL